MTKQYIFYKNIRSFDEYANCTVAYKKHLKYIRRTMNKIKTLHVYVQTIHCKICNKNIKISTENKHTYKYTFATKSCSYIVFKKKIDLKSRYIVY